MYKCIRVIFIKCNLRVFMCIYVCVFKSFIVRFYNVGFLVVTYGSVLGLVYCCCSIVCCWGYGSLCN